MEDTRKCGGCGLPILDADGRVKYHPECRRSAYLKIARERTASLRQLKEPRLCRHCGLPVTGQNVHVHPHCRKDYMRVYRKISAKNSRAIQRSIQYKLEVYKKKKRRVTQHHIMRLTGPRLESMLTNVLNGNYIMVKTI